MVVMGSSSCCSVAVVGAVLVFVLVLDGADLCDGGKTSTFVRKVEKAADESADMPLDSDDFRVPPGCNAPQQVHITQGDHVGKGVIVSWVTPDETGSSEVLYWSKNSEHKKTAKGKVYRYQFYNYTSGYIQRCTLNNLMYNTKYYYEVGIGHTVQQFWSIAPPEVGPDVPYTSSLIGKLLIQTERSPITNRIHKKDRLLYVGDLSYADNYLDHDKVRWDTWGRFVERSVAYQPWILTAGNHELDFAPEIGENEPFMPFSHRYHVPYRASNSTAPFWYSIKRASAYIIVLSSYSAYGKDTPQYLWLQQELPKVNRTETPWLIVTMHSPWYNSYNYHYMEGETMRVMYESWFVKYKVDVVFAGHVHAYEQSPKYSAFREASFGHAIFDIKNRTHAYYSDYTSYLNSWHRNQDGYAAEADSMWFFNRIWHPIDDSTSV
ncbi:hypothetical protein ACJRO7_034872 [Eucalyptus globulus]|uniref:Purple acid phosphatase n=1 Tax=Eucalyptus globulus TaxID=34317 RepID=A0ABD3J426_EUCGL